MNGNRLALVADDTRLAGAIQTHLKRVLGQNVFHCTLDTLQQQLSRDHDGLLLLAAAVPADAERIYRLVQEIYLQKLPPIVTIVQSDYPQGGPNLDSLAPYVARQIRWPDDANILTSYLRDRGDRIRDFFAPTDESIHSVISRRLLRQTPSLVSMVDRIAIAATHEVTVLLTGETGTGKTFLARLMHDCSPRKTHPFLTVPCGAQPANLVESAFFGHVKGAFTGADRAKVGKFEAAGRGTILLDEIDTLALEQQAGLLRVIETGEYEPVGSNETKLCEARIIVASNWDLEEAVGRGKFREDLYYRLNVMSFHLPPLRERVQDIAPLVRGMAARFNTKFRKDLFDIHTRAMDALEAYPWPGNIRQLENFIQQAVLVSSGQELRFEHLPQQVREHRSVTSVAETVTTATASVSHESLSHNREQLERNVIQRALANNGYSRARAANALGISRVTLYKKMKKYGLMRVPMSGGSV